MTIAEDNQREYNNITKQVNELCNLIDKVNSIYHVNYYNEVIKRIKYRQNKLIEKLTRSE